VFEAKAVDTGLGFLIAKAADFARKKDVAVKQVYSLLERLQDGIQTLLVTDAPHRLPCHPTLSVRQSIKARLPGMNTMLLLDKERGMFRPLGQSSDVGDWVENERRLFGRARGALNVQVRYRGYGEEVQALCSRLAGLLKVESLRPRRAGIDAARLPGSFIEIVFLPTDAIVRRTEEMVEKWGEY
jgi:hypothetical protein